MGLFGSGATAAAVLRDQILAGLGAEPEWSEADAESGAIRWTSGPVTTFLIVEDGPDSAPDLGVLRIVTPIATVTDEAWALHWCNELNLYATTNRWTVAAGRYGGEETTLLRVSCSFVVGPHNIAALRAFAEWCVREQIAIATAKMTSDIADVVRGKPCLFFDHAGGPYRSAAGWHEVVYHYDRVVAPNNDLPGEPLGAEFNEALRALVREMLDEGNGAWFSAGIDDHAPYVTYETPFAWDKYPDNVITTATGGNTPTARVETLLGAHPHMGTGLLITMRVPVELTVRDALATANALNLLDAEVAGATHSVGAWFAKGRQPTYVIYLPAVLASEEQDIGLPAVLRELQLTLARQALLARRLLLPDEELEDSDRSGPGLRLAASDHGLAWGETGEGRTMGARFLARLYGGLVGDDTEWADTRPDGFTWWPYQQAQELTATPYHADAGYGASILISTEVRRGVPRTDQALQAIARQNAELSQSALILRADGRLDLVCRLFINASNEGWANTWAPTVAASQFIMARDLKERLADLGEAATSAHPRSGARPKPDQLFTLREDVLIEAAGKVRWGLQPVVALLGMVGQYALPYQLSPCDEGEVDFTWRPSHSDYEVPADPAVRVTAHVTDTGSGPGWLVRSTLPLTGDTAARARWCNARNVELIGTPDAGDLTAFGGFGLDADGECALGMWMSPFFVQDSTSNAKGLVNSLFRYHQGTIIAALRTDPSLVATTPLTPGALAEGLRTLVGEVGWILRDLPEDYGWSVRAGDGCAVVSLSETSRDEDEHSRPVRNVRTVLRIPCGYNRAELSLLYAALLGHSAGRPAEQDGTLSARQLFMALRELQNEGLLRQQEGADWNDGWVFRAGNEHARLEVDLVRYGRGPMESALRMYDSYASRLSGVIGRDVDPATPGTEDSLVGTWYGRRDGSTSYEVIIPPTNSVWIADYMAVEALMWVIRHIVERVQATAS